MSETQTLRASEAADGAAHIPGRERVDELVRLFQAGQYAAALALASRMVEQFPRYFLGWQVRAMILQHLGSAAEAEACYGRALQLQPNLHGAHYNLGLLLLSRDRPHAALESFRKAIEIDPRFVEAHNSLGAALELAGRAADAEACYSEALRLKPDYPEAGNNLANLLVQASRLHEAEALYRRALQVRPDFAEAHDNLGAVLQDLGRFAEAEASYRRALAIDPGFLKAHSDLLLCMNFTNHPTSRYLEEARTYGRAASARVTRRYDHWHCARGAKPLRVGLVSGDLREHPVGHFLESLLEHIEPDRIELFAYPTAGHVDDLSRRMQRKFRAWRPVFPLADDAAAQAIHTDGIHVLIDLSGHTANNRLPVFARRPAPVQASWLGYFASTGLTEIDHILLDRVAAPEEEAPAFSERIYRLAGPRYCFTPPAIDAPVQQPPALERGYVTFCCFNTLNKVNDAVVMLWTGLMRALPDSRLFLKARQLQDPAACAEVVRRFGAEGIAEERLLLEGKSPRSEYLRAYGRADIALDPFPYTGGATTLESLWMGVPVLTLRGDRLLSRQGASILTYAGLDEWIAGDLEDFVERAIERARDLHRLATLRAQLRARLMSSPLFDAATFARDFQTTLEDLWRGWCNGSALHSTIEL